MSKHVKTSNYDFTIMKEEGHFKLLIFKWIIIE